MNLQVARLVVAKVEEDRKVLDDLPTLVAAAEKGKAKDVQDQFVMVHRVDKFVSSVVRRIIGHVTVQRWMMDLQIQRSDILGLTPMVRGPAILFTNRKLFDSPGPLELFGFPVRCCD